MAASVDTLLESTERQPHVQNFVMAEDDTPTQKKQWLATASATLSMLAAGTVYGWTTTSLSSLLDGRDVPVKITSDESSWIVALTVVGSTIGPFLGAWLASKYGRKWSLMSSSIFYIIGWIIVLAANNVGWLYASRIILGIGVGISYTTSPLYVSEVADTNIRGALGTLIAINVFAGSLLACGVGPVTSYTTLAAVLLVVPILFVGTFVWFPETPYYLASRGQNDKAMKALMFLKEIKDAGNVREDLLDILRNIDQQRGESEGWRVKIGRLLSSNNKQAFLIVFGLIVAQQMSGNFTTMQYLETLFRRTSVGIDSNIATIIVITVGFISGTFATALVERAGRKLLLLLSSLCSALSLAFLAIYLLLEFLQYDLTSYNLLPVVDVILFQIAYQIGLGTLPNALIGELFTTDAKPIAGAAITISDGVLGFAVSKLYQVIGDLVGNLNIVYFVFSGSCLLAFFFVLLYVPETRSKSFAEIQAELSRKTSRWRRRRASQEDGAWREAS